MGSGTKDEWAFTNVLFSSGHDGMYPRDKGRGLLTEGHGNLWGGGGSPSCFLGSPWHSHPPCLIPLLPASTLGLLIGVLVLGDLQSQAGQVK